MTLKSVVFVLNMQKPEWCLAVKTTYFIPASLARAVQSLGSNFFGLKYRGSVSK